MRRPSCSRRVRRLALRAVLLVALGAGSYPVAAGAAARPPSRRAEPPHQTAPAAAAGAQGAPAAGPPAREASGASLASPVAEPSTAALVLHAGATARQQLVGVARDVVVAGEALSDVAALDGSVRVSGHVAGDVIVLGGDVVLAGSARVDGDVFALGGTVQAAPGAQIGGRAVSHPTASAAWLTLLEGPSVGLPAFAPLVVGAKLALLTAWLALTLLLFAVSGRELTATAESVRREPFRNFFLGLTTSLALVLAVVLFAALAAALVGVPLLLLVVLFALLLKLWGMVAVFAALGQELLARLGGRSARRPVLAAAGVGLAVLGVLKLLPWVGTLAWTVATLIGVGAALDTKLGRREPWFQGQPAA